MHNTETPFKEAKIKERTKVLNKTEITDFSQEFHSLKGINYV